MKQPPANFRKKHRWSRRGLLAGAGSLHLLLAGRGVALDPAKDILQYNCPTWSRENGLPVSGINAIAQTKDGYLWFGTSAGLVRFDGIEFKLLDFHSVANVRNSCLTSLSSARSGGLWVGLENSEFGFFDGQSFSLRSRTNAETAVLNVGSILEAKDGTVWLAAQQQAGRVNRSGELEPVLKSDSATNLFLNVLCGYEDRHGRLWFGTADQGVYCWQDGKITKLPDPELDATLVLCIAEDVDGQIWVGTSGGLRCYDANLKRREIPQLWEEVRALLVDRQGVLWIGTSGRGLVRYHKGPYDVLRKADGLASDYVKALGEDSEGSLWVGTRDGISQISDVKFPIQHVAGDLEIKDALSVGASHRGGVWITSSGGVNYFDPQAKTYTPQSGLPNPYSKRVFEARNGDLYVVSGASTLVVFSGGKAVATNSAPNMIVGMAEDEQGVVVSVGGELYRAGTNYFRPYTFNNGEQPPFYWIFNLASGRDGVIWVACGNGIFRVKDGAYQHWSAAEGLSDPNVQSVCEDQDGVVWAGLLSGIARLKDNQVRLINRKNGLFDDNIYAIVPDDLGNLWVDSGRGIFRVARQTMNDFADGKTDRVECMIFDGIESVKVAAQPAPPRVGCKTADGRIWFPSPLGVVMIDPAHIPVNRFAPLVHIERIRVNGKEVGRNDHAVVPPGKGELEFHYNALSFIAPEKARFRYRLEGYDKDWVDAGERRMAFYTNLKPGSYTFRVIAANADGVWTETGDSLELELRPHFYQTIWFYLLCGGGAFATLIGGYLWRIRRLESKQRALQKNHDLLESKVQERTSELRNEIAERKRAEAALRESQALYYSLADQLPANICRKDAEGRYIFVNSRFCRSKGRTADEIVGQTVHTINPKGMADEAIKEHALIMRTGQAIEKEEFYQQPDGTVQYLQVIKAPVFAADGKIIGTQGIQFDITQHKQIEEALRESQALYFSLVDQVPAAVFRKDAEGRYVFVNSSFCRIIEMSPDQILGKTSSELVACMTATQGTRRPVSEKLGTQGMSHHELIMQTGRQIVGEDEYQGSDGKQSCYHTVKSAVFGADGKIIGSQGIMFDITERKQAEATLAETSALLEALLQNTTDKIYFKDLQSRFVRFSQQCLEVFHLTQPAELQGKTDFDFFSEEHARPAFEAEQEIIRTGKPIFNLEEKETHRDGRVSWALTSKMAWRDQAGNVIGTMGISRDITARKRMEEQLFQSQKMETVGKLAGGVAHEFNSILTAIICQSELLMEDLPAGSPLAENATEIRLAAERAAVLTRQLLAYGRKQFLQPEILDLNAVLAGLESALRHLMGPGADVRIVPAAGLKAVKADAGQLEQVIMNLAMNAADAMPNGGQLTLETANVTLDQEYVSRYPELKAGDYVMLAITDTGMGMREEVKARVFEPFFTTKDVGQGTGLGLSTCYGILKQSGGHISVYSEPGRGTTFKIYLPPVEPQTKIPLQRLASLYFRRGTETIRLVEDAPARGERAATLLRRLGYTVLAAANGLEALRLKQQRGSGHIDLLFTDVVMPHMSGKELADRVQALSPHTRILFTSGYTENTIVQQGGLNPGAAFLQKPFTPSALARKVREVLDQVNTPEH